MHGQNLLTISLCDRIRECGLGLLPVGINRCQFSASSCSSFRRSAPPRSGSAVASSLVAGKEALASSESAFFLREGDSILDSSEWIGRRTVFISPIFRRTQIIAPKITSMTSRPAMATAAMMIVMKGKPDEEPVCLVTDTSASPRMNN